MVAENGLIDNIICEHVACCSVCVFVCDIYYLCVHIQVIAGAGMDVDFTILSPEGILLIMESRRSDGVHVLVLPHTGLNP